MTKLHLRPIQFVDAPMAYANGAVARLAGGMSWFAAYEVVVDGLRSVVPVAGFAEAFGGNERAMRLHAAITTPRAALTPIDSVRQTYLLATTV